MTQRDQGDSPQFTSLTELTTWLQETLHHSVDAPRVVYAPGREYRSVNAVVFTNNKAAAQLCAYIDHNVWHLYVGAYESPQDVPIDVHWTYACAVLSGVVRALICDGGDDGDSAKPSYASGTEGMAVTGHAGWAFSALVDHVAYAHECAAFTGAVVGSPENGARTVDGGVAAAVRADGRQVVSVIVPSGFWTIYRAPDEAPTVRKHASIRHVIDAVDAWIIEEPAASGGDGDDATALPGNEDDEAGRPYTDTGTWPPEVASGKLTSAQRRVMPHLLRELPPEVGWQHTHEGVVASYADVELRLWSDGGLTTHWRGIVEDHGHFVSAAVRVLLWTREAEDVGSEDGGEDGDDAPDTNAGTNAGNTEPLPDESWPVDPESLTDKQRAAVIDLLRVLRDRSEDLAIDTADLMWRRIAVSRDAFDVLVTPANGAIGAPWLIVHTTGQFTTGRRLPYGTTRDMWGTAGFAVEDFADLCDQWQNDLRTLPLPACLLSEAQHEVMDSHVMRTLAARHASSSRPDLMCSTVRAYQKDADGNGYVVHGVVLRRRGRQGFIFIEEDGEAVYGAPGSRDITIDVENTNADDLWAMLSRK